METRSVLRHLLSDEEALEMYHSKKMVSLGDLKRHLLLIARNEDHRLPDHHYRLLVYQSFEGLKNIADVLTTGTFRLVDGILLKDNDRLLVDPKHQYYWQDMITAIPPLLLQSSFLKKSYLVDWDNQNAVRDFFKKVIDPNFRYTALPSPAVSPLKDICIKNGGFHDLHMHLSGSTETDVAWQDYLRFPDKIYAQLLEQWNVPKVRELLEQESSQFTPLKLRKLLTVARRLRYYLFLVIYDPKKLPKASSFKSLLDRLSDQYIEPLGDTYHHPFEMLVNKNGEYSNPLAFEALMYVRVLDYITANPNNRSAEIFHYYLLILGLCNRLLVQQTHQYGFEQFQKITLSGLREYSERSFERRFYQIRGNDLDYLSMLEGRFSPKDSEKKLTEFVDEIVRGWKIMAKADAKDGRKSPGLQLVAHFIKKEDERKKRDPVIRHRALRIDVWKRALVLGFLVGKYDRYADLISGVDAASSELDAPPEVFAPAFRYLKRKDGIEHFTYHAGEDFHHIISGIRAIFEAIEFTELTKNDRIGHAVACGLSPDLWLNTVGQQILIAQGEWLDNMVFLWHLSTLPEGTAFIRLRKKLKQLIEELSLNIYQISYSPDIMRTAWLYRKYEPMLMLSTSREQAIYLSVFDEDEWNEIKAKKIDPIIKELLRRYNSAKFREAYEEIITVDSLSLLTRSQLVKCQQSVLKIMKEKGIVIETLPTSNVRIGHHKDFKTYHLQNWLKWSDEGKDVPPIVIGTDDTGIFATNIFNEHANIYKLLVDHPDFSTTALARIQILEDNAKAYRFGDGTAKILK